MKITISKEIKGMNTFMNNLENMTNFGYTENGELKHNTTRSAVMDMFSLCGAYRHRSDDDCVLAFKKAFEENGLSDFYNKSKVLYDILSNDICKETEDVVYTCLDDILNNQTITNARLKTIIDVIEVDSDSNVEVRLKLLNEIGSTPTVITNFNDIKDTVTESNIST